VLHHLGMPEVVHGRLLLQRAVLLQKFLLVMLKQPVVAHVPWQRVVVLLLVCLPLLDQSARLDSLPHGLLLEGGVYLDARRVDRAGVGI
jgi:hypothetical protein